MTTVTARDGATSTSEFHEWLSTSTSPPYDNRQIVIQNGKLQWEQATVNGRLDLYDPATNTVYLAPGSAPHQVPDDPNGNSALAEVHYLLGQPSVTVNPNAVFDDAPAIECIGIAHVRHASRAPCSYPDFPVIPTWREAMGVLPALGHWER